MYAGNLYALWNQYPSPSCTRPSNCQCRRSYGSSCKFRCHTGRSHSGISVPGSANPAAHAFVGIYRRQKTGIIALWNTISRLNSKNFSPDSIAHRSWECYNEIVSEQGRHTFACPGHYRNKNIPALTDEN